jgi:hypothetical protein
MTEHLQGSSKEIGNNFLGSDFWEPGVQISGVVRRKFDSANGQCYAIELAEPVDLNGGETREVALGNLTGLRMAIQAAGAEDLEVGDKFTLECTDLTPTGKGNPRIDFSIRIDRR